MMMSEFTARTGFEPTCEEYQKIEEAYYHFDGDKDAFCQAFVEGDGEKKLCRARADKIDLLQSKLLELDKQFQQELGIRDARIEKLTADLDRELEWQPATGTGTNMTQGDYEHLRTSGQVMSDEAAKLFIADECGFSPEKIRIHHTASTYEVNKHRQLRKAAEYDRPPVYESTDWNYVRFDCAQFMYEMVNGELRFYCR